MKIKEVDFVEWLDDIGYGIFKHDGTDEYILARAAIQDDELVFYEEILQSKQMSRLLKRHKHELATNKDLMSTAEVKRALKGLCVKTLLTYKPSYYNLIIDEMIAVRKKKDEVTKTKRKRKKGIKKPD